MGGSSRSRYGEGLSWALVAELPLPPLRYTTLTAVDWNPSFQMAM